MITNDRMLHMLGVARRCYVLAKEEGFTEDICRDFFVMGLLHDVGYEFTDQKGADHAQIGYEMLSHVVNGSLYNLNNILESIKNHGDCTFLSVNSPKRLLILNEADMTTDSKGNYCSIKERLNDIKERYGVDSFAYAKALTLVDVQELYKNNDYESAEESVEDSEKYKDISERKLLSFDDRIIKYKPSSTDIYLAQTAFVIINAYGGSYKPHLYDLSIFNSDRDDYYKIKHTPEGYSLLHINKKSKDESEKEITVRATTQNLSDFVETVFVVVAGNTSVKWGDVKNSKAVQRAFEINIPNNKDLDF